MSTSPNQRVLIDNLRKLLESAVGGRSVCLLETHISYVLLAGEHAFKIKKAVDLGFLNFQSLTQRHFFCDRELKLNRRFSPQIYEDVLPITGSPEFPVLGGPGEPIEFAVKMRQFPQTCRVDMMLHNGEFKTGHVDALAVKMAAYHQYADRKLVEAKHGGRKVVAAQLSDAASNLLRLSEKSMEYKEAEWLSGWCANEIHRLAGALEQRLKDGQVRDCHGDLHLANIVTLDGEVSFFDCIEFDDALRYIDVMNDLAFPVMDLQAHGRADLAQRLLNAYLELTGDYAGLEVLRLYVVYRALIRAQVALLQQGSAQSAIAYENGPGQRAYLDVAMSWAQPQKPFLMLMHGYSGSGKTAVSQEILQVCGAVRLRSDVERKRLLQRGVHIEVGSKLAEKAYSREFTLMTYLYLLHLAQALLDGGYSVIVDACFLRLDQRQLFHQLAAQRQIPFEIVDVHADENIMRGRIRKRMSEGKDASDADLSVLDGQLKAHEPFTVEELSTVVSYESSVCPVNANRPKAVRALLQSALDRMTN